MSGKMTWSDAKLDIFSGTQNKYFKGVIGYKTHFYMLFEHKCVLAVCVHNHPIMIKIHPVVFFYLYK